MLFHRLSALVSSFISLLCQDLNWLVSESGFHLFSHLYLSQKGEQMLCDPRHSARHHCCTSIGLWWSMGIAWCFCIDYGNVSRWMEPDLSPGFMQFLLREEKTGEQQSDITHLPFLFFACMTLPVDLNSTSLTRIFAQAPEDGCQAPREFLRSGEAARSHPAWTSSAKLSAVVGPLTSPIRCHGKLRSYNVGIQ